MGETGDPSDQLEHVARRSPVEDWVSAGDVAPISSDLLAAGLPQTIDALAARLRVSPVSITQRLAQVMAAWFRAHDDTLW